jgi:hypothetical protein
LLKNRKVALTKQTRRKAAGKSLSLDPDSLKEATGTESRALMMRLLHQTVGALWVPESASEEEQDRHLQSAIALLQGIKPTNEIEGMLATQMVATHSAAMECLRRAMLQSQTFEGREQNLKHAAKLLAIYARQMDALNKNRGKGQQKVTVEHVHVEAGGQAVVGNVETMPNGSRTIEHAHDAPKAISHKPQAPFTMNKRTRAAAKRRPK